MDQNYTKTHTVYLPASYVAAVRTAALRLTVTLGRKVGPGEVLCSALDKGLSANPALSDLVPTKSGPVL